MLFVYSSFVKLEAMKKIILLLIVSTIYISGFSQNSFGKSSTWNNINVEENHTSTELKIYPNPCKQGKVTLEFSSKEIIEVRLNNIAGKEVLVKKFSFPENKKQIQLNDIPNGIYLIRIKTTDNKQVVKKLMVSKN
jgi:hypothetical protein